MLMAIQSLTRPSLCSHTHCALDCTQASTVSSTFRKQLESLVEQLSATEPHYIKCIKPNNLKVKHAASL